MDGSTDAINIITILKQTTIGDKKYRNNKDITKPDSLINLNYKYDDDLSIKSTIIFYKEEDKKMILICDGLDGTIADKLRENPMSNVVILIKYVKERNLYTKNLFEKIKKKYIDYKKIALGYSLGGYYLSKYIDDSFIKGYIFSGIFVKNKNNIINYVNNIDISTLLSDKNSNIKILKNTNLIKFLLNNKLNINKIPSHYIIYSHLLDSINENEIPDIVF